MTAAGRTREPASIASPTGTRASEPAPRERPEKDLPRRERLAVGWRAGAAAALARLRHDLGIAATPAFRAMMLEPIRTSAEHGAALIVGAALLNLAWLVPAHFESWPVLVLANVAAVVAAIAGTVALRRRPGIRPEAVTLMMLTVVALAIAVVGGEEEDLALVAAGYFLLLAPIVALLIPWDTRVHLAWLGGHALLVAVVTEAVIAPTAVDPGGASVMIGLLVVAAAVSVFGHLANIRARVESHVAIEAIELLNRQLRRDDARLVALNRRLERLGLTDTLTGLRNRAALKRDLPSVLGRVRRHGDSYALMIVDLDHFKAVNDGLGHFMGDKVLRRSAQAMEAAVRVSDAVYRFGGEEFLIVVPIASREEAVTVAERVREAIGDLGIGHPANPPHARVTVSIGVTVVDRSSLDDGFDTWLRTADAALYRAKRDGRNRVEAAWPDDARWNRSWSAATP